MPGRGRAPARVWGIALASHLDHWHVLGRMAAAARAVLAAAGITADIAERSDAAADRAGAALALFAEFTGGARLDADRAGAPHRPAERIGARVARQLLQEIGSGATIDRHASDPDHPVRIAGRGNQQTPDPLDHRAHRNQLVAGLGVPSAPASAPTGRP